MELKVLVDGELRVVCGLTEATTCQEIIYALAHAANRTGRFVLVQTFGSDKNHEKPLAPNDKPLALGSGDSNKEVFGFELRTLDVNAGRVGKEKEEMNQPSHNPATSTNSHSHHRPSSVLSHSQFASASIHQPSASTFSKPHLVDGDMLYKPQMQAHGNFGRDAGQWRPSTSAGNLHQSGQPSDSAHSVSFGGANHSHQNSSNRPPLPSYDEALKRLALHKQRRQNEPEYQVHSYGQPKFGRKPNDAPLPDNREELIRLILDQQRQLQMQQARMSQMQIFGGEPTDPISIQQEIASLTERKRQIRAEIDRLESCEPKFSIQQAKRAAQQRIGQLQKQLSTKQAEVQLLERDLVDSDEMQHDKMARDEAAHGVMHQVANDDQYVQRELDSIETAISHGKSRFAEMQKGAK